MQTTTPQLIRDGFVEAIKAIVPAHLQHRDSRFRYVRSVDEVPGPSLRNFHVDIPQPAMPVTDGVFGSGVEFEMEVVVYVNYGGLAPERDDSIVTEDGAQIWATLQLLYDPALAGLRSVEPNPFVSGVSDAGYLWGAFSFRVRYLHNV
jgi:hypothetical protein